MPPPPLLGYNNNVRHRGRIFHIQTEDSGVGSPRIKTHLFADGGRIVRSTRTDYSEHVCQPDMAEKVKNLMKEQHKAMFVALRSGQLDGAIGFDESAPLSPSVGPPESLPLSSQGAPLASNQIAAIPGPASTARPPVATAPLAASPAVASPAVASPAASAPGASAANTHLTDEGTDAVQRPYAAPRPSAIFSVAPSNASIFGDVGIDEKSLDAAILSYLAEDPKKNE